SRSIAPFQSRTCLRWWHVSSILWTFYVAGVGIAMTTDRISTASEETALRPSVPLWRQGNYMLLWSGQVVSAIGSQVSGLALPLLVLALTHSPLQTGLVGALQGLPY